MQKRWKRRIRIAWMFHDPVLMNGFRRCEHTRSTMKLLIYKEHMIKVWWNSRHFSSLFFLCGYKSIRPREEDSGTDNKLRRTVNSYKYKFIKAKRKKCAFSSQAWKLLKHYFPFFLGLFIFFCFSLFIMEMMINVSNDALANSSINTTYRDKPKLKM